MDAYGPGGRSLCAEMPLNAGIGGITRRFMNCLGSSSTTRPPWQLCMGNTAQVHRAVYGWFAVFQLGARPTASCTSDRTATRERWPERIPEAEGGAGSAAQSSSKSTRAKRKRPSCARLPPAHPLRHRCGAHARRGCNVIIEEGLYDHDFVEQRVHRLRRIARARERVDARARCRSVRHLRRPRTRDGTRLRRRAGCHHPLGRGARHADELHLAIAAPMHPARNLRLPQQERIGVRPFAGSADCLPTGRLRHARARTAP